MRKTKNNEEAVWELMRMQMSTLRHRLAAVSYHDHHEYHDLNNAL